MNGLASSSLSAKKNCEYYSQKIAEHSPPKTENDERLIRSYQRILIRDRSLLYNLELLEMVETMRKDATAGVTGISSNLSMSSTSLDLDELRVLLDENSDKA
ncbi:hypothetical protein [Candidatus Thiodiazotropha sp. CDECU1]|uniref:hypothetical protein n=1 Tax=Candidatus Thiodiazotropha sp. CDECU1 TaxID=3065865 RepID=UPI00292FEBDA|nr:hypothetical protein [Candidatus Thiodiazotropha sp. CDECU1]